MTRAMYFESNRSSQEGMLAVGTVVMNRVESGKYPKTVCGVVGQKKQFAAGVLSKPMGKGKELAAKTARIVLRGRKHPRVGKAMFFHTAGHSFPYTNMHYVTIAGGNAFYEKRKNATSTQDSVARRESRLSFSPPQRHTSLPRDVWTPVTERFGEAPAPASASPWSAPPPSPATIYDTPQSQRLAPMQIEDIIQNGG